MATTPQYIVRLVHYFRNDTYALHFQLDEATNDPRDPLPRKLKNLSIGYDHCDAEFLIVKEPLINIAARVIYEFTTTVRYRDVRSLLLRLNADPPEEWECAVFSYEDLRRKWEAGFRNVFLEALMSAYVKTGGRTTSWGLMGYTLDILSRQGQVLPANELREAKNMLISPP